ncbi:MAG: hypothetical protein K2M60_04065 [Lachnospiraceae bacterium]|nr:hypothetical protein [Lachnospiraceae bacterium]MDE6251138.1 hypothetical protein [Lachnospiraceae bacterium]
MNECKLILEIKNDEVLVRSENTDMTELAVMCGAIEQIMGLAAFRRGVSLDDIKSNMLDIHLEAMQTLTEQIIREGGEKK